MERLGRGRKFLLSLPPPPPPAAQLRRPGWWPLTGLALPCLLVEVGRYGTLLPLGHPTSRVPWLGWGCGCGSSLTLAFPVVVGGGGGGGWEQPQESTPILLPCGGVGVPLPWSKPSEGEGLVFSSPCGKTFPGVPPYGRICGLVSEKNC